MVEKSINGTLTSTRAFAELFPFESKFTDIGGQALHYVDEGRGTPVLMVHGNPTWSFYFRNLIAGLSKNFRAIAPDHIGCGFSDKPGAEAYSYTLESRVRDLETFVAGLKITEKINLVVHDWGGMIGLAFALRHPEMVDKIVITNTSGFFLPKEKSFPFLLRLIKGLPFFAVPAVLGLNAFARGALYLAAETKLPRQVKAGLAEPYNSWKNRIATLKFVQDIPICEKDRSYALVDHVDRHLHLLSESRLLFLWGARDFVFDLTFLNEFKRRFPRAKTHVFHDAGHYLFEDKPAETLGLINAFLTQ
nr:alpha/beta fold hydrolase [Desulfobacula sp.]